MKKLTLDHLFECDVDTYWDKCFLDEEYNRRLFHDILRFPLWTQQIVAQDDSVIKRVVQVQPPVGDVPNAVKKVLGENFGYTEHGVLDRKTKKYHVDIESKVVKDKTNIYGDIWLDPVGERRCRRKAVFHIEVRLMIVGRVIEEIITKSMNTEFKKGAEFQNTWSREKGYS